MLSSHCTPGSELSGRVHRQSLVPPAADRPAWDSSPQFPKFKGNSKDNRRLVDLGISEPRQGAGGLGLRTRSWGSRGRCVSGLRVRQRKTKQNTYSRAERSLLQGRATGKLDRDMALRPQLRGHYRLQREKQGMRSQVSEIINQTRKSTIQHSVLRTPR